MYKGETQTCAGAEETNKIRTDSVPFLRQCIRAETLHIHVTGVTVTASHYLLDSITNALHLLLRSNLSECAE